MACDGLKLWSAIATCPLIVLLINYCKLMILILLSFFFSFLQVFQCLQERGNLDNSRVLLTRPVFFFKASVGVYVW